MRRANGRLRVGAVTRKKRERGKRQQPRPLQATACSPVQWSALHSSSSITMHCSIRCSIHAVHHALYHRSTVHYSLYLPLPIHSIYRLHALHPFHHHQFHYNYCIHAGYTAGRTFAETRPPGRGRQAPMVISVRSNTYMFVVLIAIGEAFAGPLFGVPEVVAGRAMARFFRLGLTKTDPGWVAP